MSLFNVVSELDLSYFIAAFPQLSALDFESDFSEKNAQPHPTVSFVLYSLDCFKGSLEVLVVSTANSA